MNKEKVDADIRRDGTRERDNQDEQDEERKHIEWHHAAKYGIGLCAAGIGIYASYKLAKWWLGAK